MLLCKVVLGTDAYCNLIFRTRIVSGRSTPVRRVTTSAADEGDWMDLYETPLDVPKSATSGLKLIFAQQTMLCISKTFLLTSFLLILFSSVPGGRLVVNASPTPASVPGVNQPKPASILLPTSLNTLMESAGTGMTGNIELHLLCFFKL